MAYGPPHDNGPLNQLLHQNLARRYSQSADALVGTSINTPDGKPMPAGHVNILEEIKRGGIDRAPTLLGAVMESHVATGLSYDMLMLAAMAAASVAVQTVADCKLPHGNCPSGIFVNIIGPSGVGKSPAVRRMFSFIGEFEKQASRRYLELAGEYRVNKAMWDEGRVALAKAYRKAKAKGDDASTEAMRLEEHIRNEPLEPKPISVRVTSGSPEGLCAFVAENEPGVGLINAEAAQFLQARGVASILGYLAAWWSGEGHRDLRATQGLGSEAASPRVTALWASQSGVMAAFEVGKGKLSRSIGVFARCINCRISEDSRLLPDPADVGLREKTDALMSRLLQILVEGYANYPKAIERRQVGPSEKALDKWKKHQQWVDAQSKKHGLYEHATDYAAKHPETVMRLAVLIHVVEGFEGDISEGTMDLALDIGKALSGEFLAIFRCIDGIDAVGDDLHRYLKEKAADTRFSSPKRFISTSAIANRVPNYIRKELFRPAIENLVQRGLIRKVIYKRAEFIDLEPGELIQDGEIFWHERAIMNDKR